MLSGLNPRTRMTEIISLVADHLVVAFVCGIAGFVIGFIVAAVVSIAGKDYPVSD